MRGTSPSRAHLPARATIALADDDPQQRRFLSLAVESLGYEVICAASNGEELLCACGEHSVDLVLTDLDMPIVDGLEAAEAVAERGIPVILISGVPEAEWLVVEREPITARLSKPISIALLGEAIEEALCWCEGRD